MNYMKITICIICQEPYPLQSHNILCPDCVGSTALGSDMGPMKDYEPCSKILTNPKNIKKILSKICFTSLSVKPSDTRNIYLEIPTPKGIETICVRTRNWMPKEFFLIYNFPSMAGMVQIDMEVKAKCKKQ